MSGPAVAMGAAAERTMGLFLYRLMGAAMLDGSMYEGIEADRSITRQAAVTVLLSSLAGGFGAGGWKTGDPRMFAAMSAIALVTWIAWAVLMHQIGTRLLPEPQTRATLGELLRTVGFAAAPGLLQILRRLSRSHPSRVRRQRGVDVCSDGDWRAPRPRLHELDASAGRVRHRLFARDRRRHCHRRDLRTDRLLSSDCIAKAHDSASDRSVIWRLSFSRPSTAPAGPGLPCRQRPGRLSGERHRRARSASRTRAAGTVDKRHIGRALGPKGRKRALLVNLTMLNGGVCSVLPASTSALRAAVRPPAVPPRRSAAGSLPGLVRPRQSKSSVFPAASWGLKGRPYASQICRASTTMRSSGIGLRSAWR